MAEFKFDFSMFNEGIKKALKIPSTFAYLSVEQYKEAARRTLRLLSEASPQWSGYYASNWRISISGVSLSTGELGFQQQVAAATSYDKFKLGGVVPTPEKYREEGDTPKQRGDGEAVDFCMQVNEPIIQRIRTVGARLTFSNKTYNAEGQDYAKFIAENRDPGDPGWALRPVNVTSPNPIPIGYAKQKLSGRLRKLL